MIDKIDFVFPYVDDRDKVWQETYNKYFYTSYTSALKDTARFRSWDLLRYLFRGIEIYAPFINNVFMIVSNIEQVPDWINKKEVKIVLHKDIIPENRLPTFSSPCIEMHLGNIKDLSENFIYGNDDTFFTALTTPDLFFNEDGTKIRADLFYQNFDGNYGDFVRSIYNEYLILAKYFNQPIEKDKILRPWHNLTPMLKSTIKLAHELFKEEIEKSLNAIRTEKDINQYFYTELNYFLGKVEPSKIKFRAFSDSVTSEHLINTISNRLAHATCINDGSWVDFNKSKKIVEEAFLKVLPKQSKYELNSNRPTRPSWLKKEV